MTGKGAETSKSVYLFTEATKFIDTTFDEIMERVNLYKADMDALHEKYKGLFIQTQEMRVEAEGIRSHYKPAIRKLVDKYISPADTLKIILNNFISTLYYQIDSDTVTYTQAQDIINIAFIHFDLEEYLT